MNADEMREWRNKYKRSRRGVLTIMYHKMASRHPITFTRREFQDRYYADIKYNRLINAWERSGFQKNLKPSVDRINPKLPYTLANINMLTWAENRFKQAKTDGKLKGRRPPVLVFKDGVQIGRYRSQADLIKKLGLEQANVSAVLRGKRRFIASYTLCYETTA